MSWLLVEFEGKTGRFRRMPVNCSAAEFIAYLNNAVKENSTEKNPLSSEDANKTIHTLFHKKQTKVNQNQKTIRINDDSLLPPGVSLFVEWKNNHFQCVSVVVNTAEFNQHSPKHSVHTLIQKINAGALKLKSDPTPILHRYTSITAMKPAHGASTINPAETPRAKL